MLPSLKDALLKVTRALPNGAANVTSTFLPTGKGSSASVPPPGEFIISSPALATGVMADTATLTYDVLVSDNADGSNPVTVYKSVLVQTGAGGAGCAAATARFRLPSDTKAYVGIKATKSGAGDATASNATLEYVA